MKIATCTLLALLLLAALAASSALGQPSAAPAADEAAPRTIELVVRPAPEPRPALKHRLMPASDERTPGNAAPYYYRSILQMRNVPQSHWATFYERSEVWLSTNPAVFPKEEVAKWLPAGPWHSQLKTAAYREFCEWDFRIQDLRGMDVISFPLQEIQDCRQLARLIQLRAHYEIMDGRPADALQTLRLGYQLGHDVAEAPFLVSGLVGIAIAEMMNQELAALIEHGDMNLYWAIAALPQPLIDLRPAMQFEMTMPQQLFPFLKDAETAQRTPEQWRQLVVDCMTGLDGLGGTPTHRGWQMELLAAALAAKLYPAAKESLVAGGMDVERVEAMPVGQVLAIQTARSTEYAFQEIFKQSLLPYHEALARASQVENRLIREGHLGPGIGGLQGLPIANLLLPAVNNVVRAEARSARNLAALQAIEAIRMHAAGSSGKLPSSLADITIVPVPNNPATGQPFPYQFDAAAGAATLEVPAVSPLSPRQDGKSYVIRLQ